jgi:tripartite-type tricarboxylate transporter receptor subunit TctC
MRTSAGKVARRRFALWLPTLGLTTPAWATDAGTRLNMPRKPLRIIVVYPAGGISDQICRSLAERLSESTGRRVLIENQAGAGGSVGMAMLARAAPDGNTLAYTAVSTLTLLPQVQRVNYDAASDFAPVIAVTHTPTLLVGTPSFQGEHLRDLMPRANATPQGLRWATSGVGTTGHALLEEMRLQTGANIVHIPYKGGAAQINDALAGHFELLSTNVGPTQLKLIVSGRLKPLAVGAARRIKSLPHVPTFQELGFPGANLSSLFGIFAPSQTPRELIAKLNEELNQALADASFHSQLLSWDNAPAAGTAAEFAQSIIDHRAQSMRLSALMKAHR